MTDPTAAPAAVELLTGFVNTRDVESATDALGTPAALVAWLSEHGLVEGQTTAEPDDLRLAIALREALREAMLAHHDAEVEPSLPALELVAAELPLRVAFPEGGPRLESALGGVRGGLAAVLAELHNSVAEGSWSRIKACSAETCQWAFYDSSRNHSRTWCSMRVCGNRAKTRTYRSRHGTD